MRDPEHYFGWGMSLRAYLCGAFATADCQQQISGPGWIDPEKYDIVSNVPPGADREQFRKMLQNLLVEQFRQSGLRPSDRGPWRQSACRELIAVGAYPESA